MSPNRAFRAENEGFRGILSRIWGIWSQKEDISREIWPISAHIYGCSIMNFELNLPEKWQFGAKNTRNGLYFLNL